MLAARVQVHYSASTGSVSVRAPLTQRSSDADTQAAQTFAACIACCKISGPQHSEHMQGH